MKQKTRLVHPPAVIVPQDNLPLVAPIYQSVKFEHDSVAGTLAALRGEKEGYFYSRSANPTTRLLERTLAGLQGREDAIVCAAGVGAIAQTLFGLLKAGSFSAFTGTSSGGKRPSTLCRRCASAPLTRPTARTMRARSRLATSLPNHRYHSRAPRT